MFKDHNSVRTGTSTDHISSLQCMLELRQGASVIKSVTEHPWLKITSRSNRDEIVLCGEYIV